MKNMILVVLMGLFVASNTFAYVSGQADPIGGAKEVEYRAVKKSATAGVSDAIDKGAVLSLDVANNNDGYTVTRVGANTVVDTAKVVCVAAEAVATGNTSAVRCVSKGYVDYLKYDATTAISAGQKLCVNSVGAAVVCAACNTLGGTNDCKFGNATENSPIVSLEAKASGTGSDLKALINAR